MYTTINHMMCLMLSVFQFNSNAFLNLYCLQSIKKNIMIATVLSTVTTVGWYYAINKPRLINTIQLSVRTIQKPFNLGFLVQR